jgi:LysM repeat protein
MMGRRIPCVAAALVVIAAVPGISRAGEFHYTVRAGESASSIAKRYYGDFTGAELLLLYNGKSGHLIRAGESLRIPYCELHAIEAGDTWSGLARRYLGRASAYPAIAALNDLDPSRSLTIGREIAMPVVIDHQLARGESLVGLAERFYGDPRWAEALIQFNEIDDPRRLPVGATVSIPLASLRLVAPPAPDPAPTVAEVPHDPEPVEVATLATATELTAPPVERPARFGIELRRARRAFEDGDFEGSRAMLQAIDDVVERDGLDSERAELWRLRAFVHVADDEPDEACASFAKLQGDIRGITDFDPELVSPKIRSTLGSCGDGSPSTGASR